MNNRYAKPQWADRWESAIGNRIRLHPNILTLIKLFFVTPAILVPLYVYGPSVLALPVLLLFLIYGVLDYLDGLTARVSNRTTDVGQWLDRVSDLPLLLGLSLLVYDKMLVSVLLAKVFVDIALVLLPLFKAGKWQGRLRTTTNFIALFTLLLLAMELHEKLRFVTPGLVEGVVLISTLVGLIVLGRGLGILRKHLIADALSLANLLCGVISIYMASKGRLDLSLLFIGLGAAFDGLDGAAARKFGSTRWGVYSDDIADGVTYGIAPGVILALYINSVGPASLALDGIIIGVCYALFTIGRLVYFTLNKSASDPNYFMGAPSVLGGILVISSAYLFGTHFALLGMMAGVACVLMVAFDTRYRHMGRLIGSRQSIRWLSLASVILIIILGFFKLVSVAIGLIWLGCIIYGFIPMMLSFSKVIGRNTED